MRQASFLSGIAGVAFGAVALLASPGAHANKIPIVDAHSQASRDLALSTIMRLMDRGAVARSILSNRGGLSPSGLVAMAAERPDRITASMEVKSQRYFITGEPEFFQRLEAMGREPRYGAISEVLLWHEQKGGRGSRRQGGEEVPEVNLPIDAPQVQAVLQMALKRGWPFVVHYEFRSLSKANYAKRMAELKGLLRAHPAHPIVLIHMGQLYSSEAAALISEFPNVYFMTSHANPIFDSVGGGLLWTKLFEGRKLAPAWKNLFVAHSDRFVMAFDNVLPRHWETGYYMAQADLWQEGLRDLPRDAANAVAHGNAIRLWKLPPLE
jgi:predicted TIM-barrel fold metal-dependent hydrolase